MSSSARRKSGWWQTRRPTPIRKRSSPTRAVSKSLRSSRRQRPRPPAWISLPRSGASRLISGLLVSNLNAGLRDYLVAGEWRPGHDEFASEDNPPSRGGGGVLAVRQSGFGGSAAARLL